MKKVELFHESVPNLSLREAKPDLFHDEDNLDLDFELEELESRVAVSPLWVAVSPLGDVCRDQYGHIVPCLPGA